MTARFKPIRNSATRTLATCSAGTSKRRKKRGITRTVPASRKRPASICAPVPAQFQTTLRATMRELVILSHPAGKEAHEHVERHEEARADDRQAAHQPRVQAPEGERRRTVAQPHALIDRRET